MWFISGPALMRTAILLTLENQSETWKEQNISSTSTIFQHCTAHNHPKANISLIKIIDQDRKQVFREAREAKQIRRNYPAHKHNVGKLNILKIFTQILGTTHNTSSDVSTNSNALQILLSVILIVALGQIIYTIT